MKNNFLYENLNVEKYTHPIENLKQYTQSKSGVDLLEKNLNKSAKSFEINSNNHQENMAEKVEEDTHSIADHDHNHHPTTSMSSLPTYITNEGSTVRSLIDNSLQPITYSEEFGGSDSR